ncbi:transglutaminase-like cysteine peptidase [Tropicimonas isoalkanivorans]|uniref:Predicted transglutaminase-like cysteine proteinase n=1 Tax=Tropicimonas isoalkanivorans TaxID=441112 RepID=A0A1I1QT88_9RHOB|nr:transglutaminase-like cysteine peptidase [Tropicimonas isoalkanivorans]SFD25289.1 Predicted transglutaminase-like cysteine proteinase [Tropicimonas isoalkanivorans]
MCRLLVHSIAAPLFLLQMSAGARAELPACGPLDIPVLRVEPRPPQYRTFCATRPDQCPTAGDVSLQLDANNLRTIETTNLAVNAEIEFLPDMQCYGLEDHWTLPTDGYGDCEDIALEKRRRLVGAGLPAGALTLAIGHHEVELFPHAVLLLESDRGTHVLDNLTDRILCWSGAPYIYERRERADGMWIRFERPD